MQKYAGIAMILGAVLFVIGAFNPAIRAVFDAATETEALLGLEANALGWDVGNLLLGLGGLLSTSGFVLLALQVRGQTESGRVRNAATSSIILVSIGAVLWALISYDRIVASPQVIITGPALGERWIFPLYSILTLMGLILLGIGLLKSEYPRWMAWFTTGFHLYLFILGLITWDATPFYWYAAMALVGIGLVVLSYRPIVPSQVVGEPSR